MADTSVAQKLPEFDPNETLRKLSESVSSYQAPAGWAHDPAYENITNTINRNVANLSAQNTQAVNRIKEDYGVNVDRAAKANSQNLEALQNKLASQGIGFSGINVKEQGRLGENYQQALGDLLKGSTRAQENVALETSQRASDWQGLLGQAQVERAGRQSQREQEAAAQEAQAKAAKDAADQQRIWMEQLTQKLTSLAQPTPTPTGQLKPPPQPQQIVQQAVRAIPPPAVKTPQQQIVDIGVKPLDLQKLLQVRGFDPGPIDGIFGQKSQLALARWKQSVGLPATADINPEIYQRLLSSGLGNIAANQPQGSFSVRNFPSSGPARAVMM